MAANVAALLDKAKVMHKLPSDYKLALVLGVSFSTPANYRTGKTLPDARVIAEAHNRAQWAAGLAQALERENATLLGRVAYLERVGSFGSANAPTLAAQRISAAS